jgi:hypothetical protein
LSDLFVVSAAILRYGASRHDNHLAIKGRSGRVRETSER